MRIHQKNVLALSATFFIIQSAYLSLQNLASSLYVSGGLGLASLATIYACYAISCLLAPVVIQYLGTKWTTVAAVSIYCVYIAVNFYPTFYTLIPGAVLMGMAAGPLWSAQGTHLTTSAIDFARITSEKPEAIISRFNGIFFLFFLASQIPGNLVTSFVLYAGAENGIANQTYLDYCGAKDCGASPTIKPNETNPTTVYILFAILLIWGAFLIPVAAIFMNSLESFCQILPVKRNASEQLKATFKLAFSPKMYLLIPLIVYNGVELGFAYGDFTKAFVSCTQGLQTIGFVMTAYGIGGGLSALLLGIANKYVGRIAIFTTGLVSSAFLLTLMLFWDPNEGAMWHLYLMAVTWSFGGALRESQTAALLGVLFPNDQEPAFANFRFWQAIAYAMTFASSIPDYVCVSYKLSALFGGLILGTGLYYLLEWRLRYDLADSQEYDEKQLSLGNKGFVKDKYRIESL